MLKKSPKHLKIIASIAYYLKLIEWNIQLKIYKESLSLLVQSSYSIKTNFEWNLILYRYLIFFSADLEDEVMVENCIMLEAPDKGEGAYPTVPACQLLLSCQNPFLISRISVLCEARVIEVYGHHGEYLRTIKNELLEEADDMIVFRGDIVLERPLALCSIKVLWYYF